MNAGTHVRDAKDLGVSENLAGCRVEREQAEGGVILGGGGEPNRVVDDGGAGPTAARYGYLPAHVLGVGPRHRETLFGRVALSRQPSELGPVLGEQRER